MKAVLRGKLIALSASKKKLERAYTSSLTEHLKALEQKRSKYTQEEYKAGNKLRAEINQVETKRTIQRINLSRSWFFEKINKIDKALTKLMKGPRGTIQVNKIKNEKGEITTETEEIQNLSDPTTKAYNQQNWKI